MGTNYYLKQTGRKRECTCCHRPFEKIELHIGKRSAGWEFSFQGYKGIRSKKDWVERINTADASYVIEDEYGRRFTPEEFLKLVEDTRYPGQHKQYVAALKEGMTHDSWQDDEGWSFTSADFC